MERGKEGGREGDREILYKVQTSYEFPGQSQQLFILLGRTDLRLIFQVNPVKCSGSVGRH